MFLHILLHTFGHVQTTLGPSITTAHTFTRTHLHAQTLVSLR